MYGLKTIPPSRFSNTNANGLWEYSPFLCGVGLMEALELAYGMNFLMWDRMPEPMSLIHLHNMLVQKGHINQAVGLYATLQDLSPTAVFVDGKVPTSDFGGAFAAQVTEPGSRRAMFQRQAIRRTASRTATDIHGLLKTNMNRFFKQKSFLGLYREAQWVPERIPDDELPMASALCMIRLGQTKHVTDSATGTKIIEDTTLVRRARSQGIDDRTMTTMSSLLVANNGDQPLPEALKDCIPEGYHHASPSRKSQRRGAIGGRELLSLLRQDIVSDVSGRWPISSLNYVWATVRMMMVFTQIEDELKRLRNPLWVHAYEQDPVLMREKRASLTLLVLTEQDEECMEVMSKAFQDPRAGFMEHIYWEDLDEIGPEMVKRTDPMDYDEQAEAAASCTVM